MSTRPTEHKHLTGNVKDDLAAWSGRNSLKARTTSRDLGTGPGDAVDFRVGAVRQHVRFQFSRLAHAEWHQARRTLCDETATLDWVFGPGTAHPETMEELYDEYGYLLRFRFETHGAVRRIRLRAEDPRRSTDWVPLDACAMTPAGLRVPGVEPRRRSGPARPPRREPGAGGDGAAVPRGAGARAEGGTGERRRFRTRPTWEALGPNRRKRPARAVRPGPCRPAGRRGPGRAAVRGARCCRR